MNTRHDVFDWFRPLYGVIALRLVLIYYTIEIGSSLFLSGSFSDFQRSFLRCPPGCLQDVSGVDLSFLFIIEEPPDRV
jgi:hypothetical protein